MSLNRLDLLSVKAADGLASAADLAELVAAGIEPRQWDAVRALLGEALRPPAVPDLAVDVLVALELSEDADISPLVFDAFAPTDADTLDISGDVIASLELAGAEDDASLSELLSESLAPGAAPDLVGGILAALELAEDTDTSALVQGALAPAGAPPELSGGIFAALGLEEEADITGAVQDALAAGAAPELAGDVLAALELSDERLDIGAALGALDAPELADGVLAELGLSDNALASLGEALSADAPELADGVMQALGADASVGGLLRDALSPDREPELWDGIAAELGAADAIGASVRDAMAPTETPELWDGIAAELGVARPQRAVAEAGGDVIQLRNWASGGLGALLAIAAAMLLVVVSGQGSLDESDQIDWGGDFALVDNTAEIEELESDAMVQFFQTEAGAPTIIYINELEPADDTGAGEGEQL